MLISKHALNCLNPSSKGKIMQSLIKKNKFSLCTNRIYLFVAVSHHRPGQKECLPSCYSGYKNLSVLCVYSKYFF